MLLEHFVYVHYLLVSHFSLLIMKVISGLILMIDFQCLCLLWFKWLHKYWPYVFGADIFVCVSRGKICNGNICTISWMDWWKLWCKWVWTWIEMCEISQVEMKQMWIRRKWMKWMKWMCWMNCLFISLLSKTSYYYYLFQFGV